MESIKDRIIKINIKLVKFLAMLLLFSVFQAQGVNGEGVMKNEIVKIEVIESKTKNNIVKLKYNVTNISGQDIWVCRKMSEFSNVPYAMEVEPSSKKVLIKVSNFIVPEHISLEAPIYAEFIRLRNKSSKTFELDMKFPAISSNPIEENKEKMLRLEELATIELEVGYYISELENNEECCMDAKKEDTRLVNCFWAENNMASNLIKEFIVIDK